MSVTLTRTRSTTFAPGGDVDGDGRADAGDILRHTLIIKNTGTTAATNVVVNDPVFANSPLAGSTANGTIDVSPIAFNDAFNAVGNTLLEVGNATNQTGPQSSFAGSVLSNDVEFFGDTFQISAVGATSAIGQNSVNITSANGGAVTMITSGVDAGSFTYVSAAGFEGTDTFTYTIRDKGLDGIYGNADDLTSTATVTITVGGANGQVWYVDPTVTGPGTGTSVDPFKSATSVGSVDSSGDYVYVKGAATGNLAMEANEHLVGTGTALVVNGVTLAAAGSNSSLSGSSGFTVTLGSGDEITGIGIGATGGAANGGIIGANFGTLTVSNATVNTTGQALSLTTGTFAGTGFVSTDSSGGTNNVSLTGVAGPVNLGSGALSGATGTAFLVSGGAGSVDYNGSISHAGNAVAISVAGKTGGTVQFDGTITSNGASNGISLANNTGATINFTNTLTLNTSASNSTTFSATGGGTVSATGSGSTINSGQGTAINVANTTIASGNLTFQSVNSSGGTATGIFLDTTGSLGGLHITGTGTAGSGGTIASKTGGDNSTTTGIGIYLNNTKDVQLDHMALHDFSNFGIRGFGVNGFSLSNSTVNGVNGSTAGNIGGTTDAGEGSIFFGYTGGDGLSGVASFTNDTISGGAASNLSIRDTATGPGDLHLFVTNDTFGQTQNLAGNQNLIVETRGAGTHTFASVTGSTFAGAASDQINFTGQTGTIVDTTITGNTLTNNHPQHIGGGGVTLATQGVMRFLFDNNVVTGADGSAITVQMASGATSLDGTISNTTIGTSGVVDSGSKTGNGIFFSAAGAGTAKLAFLNNIIQQYHGNAGMYLDNTGGSYTVDLTITGNTVRQPGAGAFAGLALTNGANTSGDTVNVFAKIANNDFSTGDPANANDIIVGQSGAASGHTFTLSGASAADVASLAAVQAFLKSTNNLNSASANTVVTAYSDNGLTSTAFQASASAPPTPTGPTAPLIASAPPPADPGTLVHTPPTSGPAIVAWDPAAAPPVVVDDGILTQAELNLLVGAAIDRWAAAGATADELAAMRAVSFTVENLAGLILGTSSAGHVTLDSDAAGFNWFVDATPGDDSEFAKTADGLRADANSIAGTRIDLLTTIMHELGHQIGLGDAYLAADRNDVMYATIDPGERRLPTSADALLGTGHATTGLDFLLSPVTLGTVPAGQTVTIVFDSTVTGGYFNQIVPTYSNASSIAYDDLSQPAGSQHFVVASNVDTIGPGATVNVQSLTLGDLVFFDANNNGLFDAGDSGVNGVAVTLFADTNNNGVLDAGDTQLAVTTTAGGGFYSFTGLAEGNYIVRVDASNFAAGQPLVNRGAAPGGGSDPDDNIDSDSNTVAASGGAFASQAITLVFDAEPGAGGNTNNTVDFGFSTLNQAPVNSVPGAQTFNEDTARVFSSANGNAITVSDVDAGSGTLTVTLDVAEGALTLGGTGGLTVTGQGSGHLVLSGTIANINAGLNGLSYQPASNANGSRTLTVTTSDNGNTGVGGAKTDIDAVTLNITAVNDKPVVTSAATLAVTEQVAVTIDSSAHVGDIELDARNGGAGDYAGAVLSVANNAGANATDLFTIGTSGAFTVSGSSLLAGGLVFATFSGGSGSQLNITFTSSGTPATTALVNAVADALRYTYNGDNPPASVDLVMALNDGNFTLNNQGVQPNGSFLDSIGSSVTHVTITAVNDPATITGPSTGQVLEAGGVNNSTVNAPIATGDLNATDPDNPNDAWQGVAPGASTTNGYGTYAVSAAGVWTYTLNNNNPSVEALNVGATLTDTFTVLTVDGTSQVVTITINGQDDAPVAQPDAIATSETTVVSGNVLSNNGSGADSDVDGPALSVAKVNGSAASVGTQIVLASGALLTLNANGTFSYDPNHKFDYLISPATAAATGAVNTTATDSFTYTLAGGGTTTVTVTINGATSAGDELRGDSGNNTITGTGLADYFDLSQGGNDTVNGGGGNDSFYFGAAFTSADTVDGGAGTNDQIGLKGNYTGANALVLGASTITNVEVIAVLPGFSYSITTVDANVAAGQQLKIFAGNLGVGDNFTFNGSAESNGSFTVYGGQGTDIITTGAGDDGIYFGPGRFDPSVDRVDGGAGSNDQLALDGNYTLTLDGVAIKNIEVISLLSGPVGSPNTFNITTADSLVGAGQTMTVWGASLETSLTFNGGAESNGNLKVYGGHGADTITTGAGNDWIWGGLGADVLNGGLGSDTFHYEAVNESTGSGHDQIIGFTSGVDKIDLPGTVAAVDPTVNGGALNAASFNADLSAAIGAGQLHAGDAVLFHPSSGTLAGTTFLIVDANGIPGYQPDQDYVIQLVTPPPVIVPTDFV